MPDYWCEALIRPLMNKAVRSAEIYKNDKTELNRKTAIEHAHNAIILARDDPVLSAETPSFVERVAAYFDDDAKGMFERMYRREESHLVARAREARERSQHEGPEDAKLTIHNFSMKSEAEFWGPDRDAKDEGPKDPKITVHNYSMESEAELWGRHRNDKDEGSTKAPPPTA